MPLRRQDNRVKCCVSPQDQQQHAKRFSHFQLAFSPKFSLEIINFAGIFVEFPFSNNSSLNGTAFGNTSNNKEEKGLHYYSTTTTTTKESFSLRGENLQLIFPWISFFLIFHLFSTIFSNFSNIYISLSHYPLFPLAFFFSEVFPSFVID